MYGLNNNLGGANNVNRTQNSAKSNKKNNGNTLSSKIAGVADAWGGLKNGKTGGERLQAIGKIIAQFMSGGQA